MDLLASSSATISDKYKSIASVMVVEGVFATPSKASAFCASLGYGASCNGTIAYKRLNKSVTVSREIKLSIGS